MEKAVEEKYVLTKSELLDLLESSIRLTLLERGGVDNWYCYCESINIGISDYIKRNKIVFENEDDEFDFNTWNLAEDRINFYPTVTEFLFGDMFKEK